MATASIPHSTSSTSFQTRPAPDPAAVLSYCQTHSNAEAANHFGIHERSVRRIKQRAAERTQTCTEDRPSPVVSRTSRVYPAPVPTFPPTLDDVAGDNTYWKCPATGELMPVIPGTHRKAWEQERRAAHARHVAAVSNWTRQNYVEGLDRGTHAARAKIEGPDRSADSSQIAVGSDGHGGHVRIGEQHPDAIGPDVRTPGVEDTPFVTEDQELPRAPLPIDPIPQPTTPISPPDASPLPIKPLNPAHDPRTIQPDLPREAMVVTRVVRVPVEAHRVGVVAWAREHEAAAKQLVALAVVVLLILLVQLG